MVKVLKNLMMYAGKHRVLTYLSLMFSAISSVLALVPFIFIWSIIKEAIEVMPNFENATNMVHNGWMAVYFSVASLLVYFLGLLCSHKSAFRIAANIKIKCMTHILKAPIGVINDIGSGKLRKIVVESSNSTETFLAHNLPDLVGAIVTPICMIIILFVFDWKLGLVSLLPIVLGFIAMSKMAGKSMARDMKKYQDSLEEMNNQAVEYVRGMPVVKTFGQSIYTFKNFKKAIDDYKNFCISYTKKARIPMLLFTLFINSAFAFLTAIALYISAKNSITNEFIFNLLFYIIYTPIIATTMTKVMFISENILTVKDSLNRINELLSIKPLIEGKKLTEIKDNSIKFENVSFSYDSSESKALDNISFTIPSNLLTAIVGPSGGGKSTIANLITHFYDVSSGNIKIGNVNIKDIKKEKLSEMISFVFQDSKLLKMSILDEATAFADPENEGKVQKAFENLSKNKTVIMIAHRLSSIVNADKIIVVENGKIIQEGTHNELLEKEGLYNKMLNDYQTSISWKVGV